MKAAVSTVLTLLALLALGSRIEELSRWLVTERGVAPQRVLPLRALLDGGLNAEDRATRTAGYYQGLLNGGAEAVATGFLAHQLDLARDHEGIGQAFHARFTGDFLWYDLPPDLDVASRAGRLVTNSQGLADREYAIEHPPRTWRVALLGDSLIRGWGTQPGGTFEARLEERLNGEHLPADRDAIEVLNFGVDGYRLTQVMECAVLKVPQYEPDAYVVSIGALAGPKLWTPHLAGLIREGRDLRYDFLRDIAREAKLDRYDAPATTRAKLAPYHLPILRWTLTRIRDVVALADRPLLVLLTPVVEPPAQVMDDFVGVTEALDELGIAYVDLRGAFLDAKAPQTLRISDSDTHPNDAGHAVLYEKLYARLLADPKLMHVWTGAE
ncbi:MAG: SGNH/GDSL hydrolase family protein [Planctomycetota bacterium]